MEHDQKVQYWTRYGSKRRPWKIIFRMSWVFFEPGTCLPEKCVDRYLSARTQRHQYDRLTSVEPLDYIDFGMTSTHPDKASAYISAPRTATGELYECPSSSTELRSTLHQTCTSATTIPLLVDKTLQNVFNKQHDSTRPNSPNRYRKDESWTRRFLQTESLVVQETNPCRGRVPTGERYSSVMLIIRPRVFS